MVRLKNKKTPSKILECCSSSPLESSLQDRSEDDFSKGKKQNVNFIVSYFDLSSSNSSYKLCLKCKKNPKCCILFQLKMEEEKKSYMKNTRPYELVSGENVGKVVLH